MKRKKNLAAIVQNNISLSFTKILTYTLNMQLHSTELIKRLTELDVCHFSHGTCILSDQEIFHFQVLLPNTMYF